MSKTVTVECSTCKNVFGLQQSQYKYQIKAGRTHFYCTRSCVGKDPKNLARIEKIRKPFTSSSPKYTALTTQDARLESSMREFTRRFRSRSKAKRNKLGIESATIDHLLDVWNSQQGKCFFTQVALVLPRDDNYDTCSPNYKASVDRIDCNIGYVDGNLRFVSHTINNLRSNMSDEMVYSFFDIIRL